MKLSKALDRIRGPKVMFLPFTGNRKLGRTSAASYTHNSTCPDNCSLKSNGCYAEGGPTAIHWNALNRGEHKDTHYNWEEFLIQLKGNLGKNQLYRHNTAGDLPGDNNVIDSSMLNDLVEASSYGNGFTYTHKPVGWGEIGESSEMQRIRGLNTAAIKRANEMGFTINLSADDLCQADYLHSLGVGPVVSVVPIDHPRHSKTPEGRHVIVCPNEEDNKITCDRCKLCAVPIRKAVIAFRAHGVKRNKVSNNIKERVHLATL